MLAFFLLKLGVCLQFKLLIASKIFKISNTKLRDLLLCWTFKYINKLVFFFLKVSILKCIMLKMEIRVLCWRANIAEVAQETTPRDSLALVNQAF